ncbi:hypothetical protein CTI12_AA195700 [Artemisia annua]|uniref:Uncharacterized protein n=1 Tax=Artemisia annua TaxID=35608 RepID=A0A2U1P388_ARTAN|nr:hypothetical protein CTI12_AA195700 [Artemisia annua]
MPLFISRSKTCFQVTGGKIVSPPINQINEDLSRCALQLIDEMEFSERTLQGISNSVNSFIDEQKESFSQLQLLNGSTGFNRVLLIDLDDNDVEPLQSSVELVKSWSLTIVNLTSIVVSLPRIPNDAVQGLMKIVGEGLLFTHLVEESLNPSSEYVNVQEAATTLWDEVKNNHTWLKNSLSNDEFEGKTTIWILNWFANTAKRIFIKISNRGIMAQGKIPMEIIASHSMYRIAGTISFRNSTTTNTEMLNIRQLFELLRATIAEILSACFTNIPRGITMKCDESIIEKRSESVKVSTMILGKTRRILDRLDGLELSPIDASKIAYIEEWRLHLKQQIP